MLELVTLAWDIVLRTAVVYLVVLIGLRLAGKREIGQMTVFDMVIRGPCRLGLLPSPKPHPDCPGYSGLPVAIREQPTGKHFDPQTLPLHIRDGHGLARWRTLSCLSPLGGNQWQVQPPQQQVSQRRFRVRKAEGEAQV